MPSSPQPLSQPAQQSMPPSQALAVPPPDRPAAVDLPLEAPTRPGDATEPPLGEDVTRWLARLAEGGSEARRASQRVYTALYGQLHRIARSHMWREGAGHTLSATALVHEAWFRMADQTRTEWRDRGHFLAVASMMMRRILVDHASAARTARRGAALEPITTTLIEQHGLPPDRDVVAVHEALLAFEAVDARAAKVVELRFFGGLEVEEVAEVLGISAATVKRDWALARAWLRRALLGDAGAGPA